MMDMGEVWERAFLKALNGGAEAPRGLDEYIRRAQAIADLAAQAIEDRRRARFERGTDWEPTRPPGYRLFGRGLRGHAGSR